MKKTGLKFFLGLFFLILLIFIFDYIFPVKIVKIEQPQKISIYLPEELNSYIVSFDIYTSFSKFSTADKLDVLNGMERNSISVSMVTDCTKASQTLEGIYGNKILFSKCSINKSLLNFGGLTVVPFLKKVDNLDKNQCKEILNLTKSLDFSILNFPKILKFFFWHPFDKDKAYENLIKIAEIEESISKIDSQKTTCFLGGVGAYSRLKLADEKGKSSILDFNYLLGMVRNKIYSYDLLSIDLDKNKEVVFNALKNGNNIIYLTNKDLNIDVFVKGITRNYLVGSVVDLSEKPVINLKVNGKNIFTSVLLNGKVVKSYDVGDIKITPKNSSSYTFVVYRYKIRLPFNILLGVSPVAVTNPIYFQ